MSVCMSVYMPMRVLVCTPFCVCGQEITPEHKSKKQAYERTHAGLESNMSKLEQEVNGYAGECRAEESRYHYLNGMLAVLQQQQRNITAEIKSYVVGQDVAEKKTTMR